MSSNQINGVLHKHATLWYQRESQLWQVMAVFFRCPDVLFSASIESFLWLWCSGERFWCSMWGEGFICLWTMLDPWLDGIPQMGYHILFSVLFYASKEANCSDYVAKRHQHHNLKRSSFNFIFFSLSPSKVAINQRATIILFKQKYYSKLHWGWVGRMFSKVY